MKTNSLRFGSSLPELNLANHRHLARGDNQLIYPSILKILLNRAGTNLTPFFHFTEANGSDIVFKRHVDPILISHVAIFYHDNSQA